MLLHQYSSTSILVNVTKKRTITFEKQRTLIISQTNRIYFFVKHRVSSNYHLFFINFKWVLLMRIQSYSRNQDDIRFTENESVLLWLKEWEDEASRGDGNAAQRARHFISSKTRFDLFSMVLGFRSYCNEMMKLFPGIHIRSHQTSQDYLELFFACQRAQGGQNNNPSALQYGE